MAERTDHRGYVLLGETAPCHACGRQTDINLLDAKPGPKQLVRGVHPEACDFTRLKCERCYGPGWLPAVVDGGHDA